VEFAATSSELALIFFFGIIEINLLAPVAHAAEVLAHDFLVIVVCEPFKFVNIFWKFRYHLSSHHFLNSKLICALICCHPVLLVIIND